MGGWVRWAPEALRKGCVLGEELGSGAWCKERSLTEVWPSQGSRSFVHFNCIISEGELVGCVSARGTGKQGEHPRVLSKSPGEWRFCAVATFWNTESGGAQDTGKVWRLSACTHTHINVHIKCYMCVYLYTHTHVISVYVNMSDIT